MLPSASTNGGNQYLQEKPVLHLQHLPLFLFTQQKRFRWLWLGGAGESPDTCSYEVILELAGPFILFTASAPQVKVAEVNTGWCSINVHCDLLHTRGSFTSCSWGVCEIIYDQDREICKHKFFSSLSIRRQVGTAEMGGRGKLKGMSLLWMSLASIGYPEICVVLSSFTGWGGGASYGDGGNQPSVKK